MRRITSPKASSKPSSSERRTISFQNIISFLASTLTRHYGRAVYQNSSGWFVTDCIQVKSIVNGQILHISTHLGLTSRSVLWGRLRRYSTILSTLFMMAHAAQKSSCVLGIQEAFVNHILLGISTRCHYICVYSAWGSSIRCPICIIIQYEHRWITNALSVESRYATY